jgi:hypothetical protein
VPDRRAAWEAPADAIAAGSESAALSKSRFKVLISKKVIDFS